ncbi:hypothetical protein OK016_21335 [Vibrio chagasii]|nr:hypothetical protein [Vibrio chagasii]
MIPYTKVRTLNVDLAGSKREGALLNATLYFRFVDEHTLLTSYPVGCNRSDVSDHPLVIDLVIDGMAVSDDSKLKCFVCGFAKYTIISVSGYCEMIRCDESINACSESLTK